MNNHRRDFELILQECLSQVLAGQETVASALGRHPDVADELRPPIEAAVWLQSHAKSFAPRPGFVAASRRRLVARIEREGEERNSLARPPVWSLFHQPWQARQAVRLVLAFALIVALFVSGAGAALAAQVSLPGEATYPVKLALEEAQLAGSLTDAGDAWLYVQFAGRRVDEIQELILEGDYDYVQSTVARFEHSLSRATDLLAVVSRQDAAQADALAGALERTLSNQTIVLTVLASAVPDDIRDDVDEAIQITGTRLTEVQNIREQLPGYAAATRTPTSSPTLIQTPQVTATPTPTRVTPSPVAPVFTPTVTASVAATTTPLAPPTMAATPTATPEYTPTPTSQYTPTPKPPNTHKPPTNTPKPPNTHKPPTNTPWPERPTDPPQLPTSQSRPSLQSRKRLGERIKAFSPSFYNRRAP